MSSLKNQQNCCRPTCRCQPSRVLRAPGTSPYHLVPKHLRTTWSPGLSNPTSLPWGPALPMAPTRDDLSIASWQTERPPPEPSDIRWICWQYVDNLLNYLCWNVENSGNLSPYTHFSLAWPYGHSRFYLEFKENEAGLNGLRQTSVYIFRASTQSIISFFLFMCRRFKQHFACRSLFILYA